jgi:hypothetical protein
MVLYFHTKNNSLTSLLQKNQKIEHQRKQPLYIMQLASLYHIQG